MNHFTYNYYHPTQHLQRLNSTGEILQELYIPFSDLSKVCVILFGTSAEKMFMENE